MVSSSSILLKVCTLMAIHYTEGLLLSTSPCNATPPCHCGISYISCTSKGLDALPVIPRMDMQVASFSIYLQDNKLTSLAANAFVNITSANASNTNINLSNNSLYQINDHAFDGIQDTVMSLNLHKNNLTTIPSAIAFLTNLEVLILTENPLSSLDAHVLSAIGGSLLAFYVDVGGCDSWPSELHFLRSLTSLTIQNINTPYIPYNGFSGHETNLKHLAIEHSRLEYVPAALCRLAHLTDFTFNDNGFVDQDNPMFEPCPRPMGSVLSVNLQRNSLRKFPVDLFDVFPNVLNLNLNHNAMFYIREEDIPDHCRVKTMDLTNNQFMRVPYALNKLDDMTFLKMQDNAIQAIDAPLSIKNLNTLMLDSNPLIYIHPDAFATMTTTLGRLSLENTSLDHVPEAITKVTSLTYLSITDTGIDCTCLTMDYMRTWSLDNVTISSKTKCEISDEPVQHFLTTSLPNCP